MKRMLVLIGNNSNQRVFKHVSVSTLQHVYNSNNYYYITFVGGARIADGEELQSKNNSLLLTGEGDSI